MITAKGLADACPPGAPECWLPQPAGRGAGGACGIVPSETRRVTTLAASVVRHGAWGAPRPGGLWASPHLAGGVSGGPGRPVPAPARKPACPVPWVPRQGDVMGWGPVLGPGLQPREGLRRGRLGGYLPGPHVRARLASQGCRPHVKVSRGGWGTEAWNPVTWSSSGQIVLCETGEKEPLGGPAAALSPRVSGACPAGRRGPRSRPWGCRLAPPAAPASQFSACLFCYGHNTQPGAPVRVQWSSGNSSSSALSGERSRVRPSDHVPCPGPRPWLSLLLLSLSR